MLPAGPAYSYTRPQRAALRFALAFTGLFFLSFSFPHPLLPDAGRILGVPFDALTAWAARRLFHLPKTNRHYSDAAGMYLYVGLLLAISALVTIFTSLLRSRRIPYQKLQYWLLAALRYYLAMQLLAYGFSKVFKEQFYLPEPNTLYTPAGQLGRDILYWSAMGSSRAYVMFMGFTEVLAALLLLIRRTQLAGALLTAGIFINVLAVNIGFGISVKLYTAVLLAFCGMLLLPQWRRLAPLFTDSAVPPQPPPYRPMRWQQALRGIRAIIIMALFCDVLWPAFHSRVFNDDAAKRPPLHGAYDAVLFIKNGDTLAPLLTDSARWRRFFFHRAGYFIAQDMQDEMHAYTATIDTGTQELWLALPGDSVERGFDYSWGADSLLRISGWLGDDSLTVFGRRLDWRKLPLMRDERHWVEEE